MYVSIAPTVYITLRDVAEALTISISTANKWMIRIRGKCLQGEQHEHYV
jgi:transposase-like protein